MLSLGSSHQYYLYREAADMRKGADGLSGLVRMGMDRDPLSGEVFIFVNRRRDKMKLLVWEHSGFVVWYKRLEAGTFELPATGGQISWQKLMLILEGVALSSVVQRKRYSRDPRTDKKAA
jgi:transposase